MVNRIGSESNYFDCGNKDFILESPPSRKRERESAEKTEGTSQKRFCKIEENKDDFPKRKEMEIFQRFRIASVSVSQPSLSEDSAPSSFPATRPFEENLEDYPNRAAAIINSPKRYASEKAEAVSDEETAPKLTTPPGSPYAAPSFNSPDFARPAASVRKILCPPPTPRRPYASSQTEIELTPIYFQNALKYKRSFNEVIAQDPRILRQIKYLGSGEFVNAWSVDFQGQVQVVKIHQIAKHIFKPGQLIDCWVSEIEQYIFLKDSKFPVVDFFSFDEFLAQGNNHALYRDVKKPIIELKDHLKKNLIHPFYRVEYVPYSIADSKEEFESRYEGEVASSNGNLNVLKKMLEDQNDPLCKVKEMFEFAWKNNVCLDLCLGNIRIRKGGEVVLIDLYYDRTEEFPDHLTSCLSTYVRDINSPLLDYLICDLPEDAKRRLANKRIRS